MFYSNHYIERNQFYQLYDLDCMRKRVQNTDVIICKLGPTSIKITNQRLEVTKEEMQKKKE